MRIYANFRHIPEIQGIPVSQRADVWRSFLQSHGYLSRETFLALIPVILSALAASLCKDRIGLVLSVLLLLVGVLVCCVTYVSLMRRPFRKYLDRPPNA